MNTPDADGNRPQLWIIAGPNGSGKSSYYGTRDFKEAEQPIWIINPDLLTARLVAAEGLERDAANLAALDRTMAWLRASIDTHQTVGLETVLSSPKYRRLLHDAKARGYEIILVYFVLQSVEDQLRRIAGRVAKGGHDVPPDKVRARRARSFEQLRWFLREADRALIYDNSGAEPRVIGRKASGEDVMVSPSSPSDLIEALLHRPS